MAGKAEVDLADIVDTPWTQLILVCDFSSPESVDEALGFDWDFSNKEYDSMFIFADDDAVLSYYHSGNDAMSREPWIYPCTPPTLQTVPQREPIVLSRDEARATFIYDTTSFGIPLWYICEPDYQVLLQSTD